MSPATAGPCRVLLVDDDATFRRVMSTELSRRGLSVAAAATASEGLSSMSESKPDVVLLDLRLPDMEGIDALRKIRELDAPPGVIVLTGHGTIDTAIQAIRLGAFDYLEKPCLLDKVEIAIQKAHEHLRLVERKNVLEDGYITPEAGIQFIGRSAAFQKVLSAIARIAPTDSTTLILGETGVGKEMVARLLHAQSLRRDRPFVVVDCAGLKEEFLQSELFGHEKGAFTGAARQKHGLFEVAHGGTIFLDEVGEMSPEIQAKLLRVLETSRFRRLGGTRELAVDVRVISATNRRLPEAIRRGHFREDLYFRLAPLSIEVPPLRERPDDIRVLVEHFTQRFNVRFGRRRSLREDAMEALCRYRWPGNCRELIHCLEQMMVLCDRDLIEPSDLPPAFVMDRGRPLPSSGGDEPLSLREVQRIHVLAIMEKAGGNRALAARILKVSERNLYRLLKKYGVGAPDKPSVT